MIMKGRGQRTQSTNAGICCCCKVSAQWMLLSCDCMAVQGFKQLPMLNSESAKHS